jgi:hypothetical protein
MLSWKRNSPPSKELKVSSQYSQILETTAIQMNSDHVLKTHLIKIRIIIIYSYVCEAIFFLQDLG